MQRNASFFHIGRSRNALILLILIHVCALLAVASLNLHWLIVVIVILGLITSLLFYASRFQWLPTTKAIVALEQDQQGSWRIIASDNSQTDYVLLASAYVSLPVSILHFKVDSFRYLHMVVYADSMEKDAYRKLTIKLRNLKTFRQ